MKYSRHIKCCVLALILYIPITITTFVFSSIPVLPALAITHQEIGLTDSTPSLIVTPNPINEEICQTSNHQTWTCTITMYGENLGQNLVLWNAYNSNSSISISPNHGNLVQLVSIVRITISNIPCSDTSFLFSGQIYGGGGSNSYHSTLELLAQTNAHPISAADALSYPSIISCS